MWIDEGSSDLEQGHELKVKVPARRHVRLHTRKILTGEEISATVTAALEAYFEGHAVDGSAPRDPDPRDEDDEP